jgi:hypothetical protein
MSEAATAHKPHQPGPKVDRGAQDTATTRPKVFTPIDDEETEARAVVAGFHAAQRALHDDQAADAQRHLDHVAEAAEHYAAQPGNRIPVQRAADSFDQALEHFGRRHPRSSKVIEQLADTNIAIRKQLRLGVVTSPASHHEQRGSVRTQANTTLPSVLELIGVRAHNAIALMERYGDHDRLEVIAQLAADLDDDIAYATWLLDQLSAPERSSFKPQLDAAAEHVHVVVRWIRTRTNHAGMERRFHTTVQALNTALRRVGAAPIEERAVPVLSEASTKAGENERADLAAAQQQLDVVLDQVHERQHQAVTSFRELSRAQDIEEGNFLEQLVTAVFVAGIGHLGGFVIEAALGKAAAAVRNATRTAYTSVRRGHEAVIKRVVDVSTDSIQGLVGQALSASDKIDPQLRAREFFAVSMEIEFADRKAKMRNAVAKLIKNSEVSGDDLRALQLTFKGMIDTYYQAYYRYAVNAWASYIAQSQLGTRHGRERDGRKVSKVSDYFGTPTAGGRAFGTSMQGTTGVLSIALRVHAAGTRPKLDRDATHVNGMNSAMTSAVVAAAGHTLDAIWLPKEVHVLTDFGHAIIALDEKNDIRDVLRWDDVRQHVGVETAGRFWSMYRREIVL